MTQTTLSLKSFFNGDPLTLEEHKTLPYRISAVGKDNAYQVSRIVNHQFMVDLIDDSEEMETYKEDIADVVEMLIDGDVEQSDVRIFFEDHGICEFENFRIYSEVLENYSLCVVNAFIDCWSMDDLEHLEEAFAGHFDTIQDFVEDYLDNIGENLPHWIAVDWDATWESALRFDYHYDEEAGVMFYANW
tara:strand:- start:122 stop:688 length:567 start_codon:yes stop_codon:yes gene_type:complete